ncbi:MAG: dihydrodipicolinate synthase family protein [Bryobacteraceae bacterium]
MSRNPLPGGVIAAVLLPRDEEGRPEWDEFERLVAFLIGCGLSGVCVNGATGEYARATPEERRTAVAAARNVIGSRAAIVAGEGAACTLSTIRLLREAESAGADAHLVPPPCFFHYREDDIEQFYRAVAGAAERPVLIYNLPAYLTGVSAQSVVDLVRTEAAIAGVKDSSGRFEILERLSAEPGLQARRYVGNDWVLAEACRRRLADGVISGVACVLPELILALWEAGQAGDVARLQELEKPLAEALRQIDAWPAPIGLEILAEARGLRRCLPAVPLSSARREQAVSLRRWFESWWEGLEGLVTRQALIEAR